MTIPIQDAETQAVAKAETARLMGDTELVTELLTSVTPNLTIEQVLQLDELQFNNFMRGLRIKFDVLGQEFSRRPLAVFALPFLKQILALLNYYYDSPALQARAEKIETDPGGNEYILLAEMWRDIASYCMKVAVITGDEQFLFDAQTAYQKAIEVSKPDTSVRPLAKFEVLLAAFKANVPIPLRTLEEYWYEIVSRTNDHDRIAKVSWEMLQIARRVHDLELEQRAKALCMEHANYLPGGYLKYAAKQLARTVMQPIQRLTYFGESEVLRPKSLRKVGEFSS